MLSYLTMQNICKKSRSNVLIILPRTSHFARSCVELGTFPHPAVIPASPVVGTMIMIAISVIAILLDIGRMTDISDMDDLPSF